MSKKTQHSFNGCGICINICKKIRTSLCTHPHIDKCGGSHIEEQNATKHLQSVSGMNHYEVILVLGSFNQHSLLL